MEEHLGFIKGMWVDSVRDCNKVLIYALFLDSPFHAWYINTFLFSPYIMFFFFFLIYRFVDALGDQIRSAVENTITNKISEGTSKLDSLLQSLPKKINVDNVAALNVTFVKDPVFGNSSIEFDINGLFVSSSGYTDPRCLHKYPLLSSCGSASKMLWISLDEAVFNSASVVYFQVSFHITLWESTFWLFLSDHLTYVHLLFWLKQDSAYNWWACYDLYIFNVVSHPTTFSLEFCVLLVLCTCTIVHAW